MAKERFSLFRKARPIASFEREEGYDWISPDELFILRPAVLQSCRFTLDLARKQQIPYTAYRLRISTGEVAPLTEFNQLHSPNLLAQVVLGNFDGNTKWKKELSYRPPQTVLSSDGRTLLWKARPDVWQTAALDGKATIEWLSHPESRHAIWLSDNLHWFSIISHYADGSYSIPLLHLRRQNDPSYERTITVAGLQDGLVAGITERGSFLMYPPSIESGKRREAENVATFSEVFLCDSHAKARRFEISSPTLGIVWRVLVSPCGNRLAWLMEHLDDASWQSRTYSLWTSDLEGEDIQEIGWTEGR